MSVEYGRGYYGVPQSPRPLPRIPRLRNPSPARAGMSPWIKLVIGAGIGAGVWFMWPRARPFALESEGADQKAPSAPPPVVPEVQRPAVPPLAGTVPERSHPPQLTQEALGRGFPSQQAYEDTVVSNARQLRETGATVILAPHLQHLTPRLGSGY